jgi:vacuolar protein sorting-associated protein 8
VGTLLTWADRILSFVAEGDFLNAIDLAQSYYIGEAPGNTNGLPDDMHLRRDLVGTRMRDLMIASTRYTFSEDRMTDGTHVTPDGRGVDRTLLFEGLVTTCARACIGLDYLDFLFEGLYQNYKDNGISRIFVTAGTLRAQQPDPPSPATDHTTVSCDARRGGPSRSRGASHLTHRSREPRFGGIRAH